MSGELSKSKKVSANIGHNGIMKDLRFDLVIPYTNSNMCNAFTGLDTTSRIFHIHKSRYQKLQKTDTMKVVAGNSTTRNMNPSDIFESGFYFSDVKTHQL